MFVAVILVVGCKKTPQTFNWKCELTVYSDNGSIPPDFYDTFYNKTQLQINDTIKAETYMIPLDTPATGYYHHIMSGCDHIN